jgi:hypothetical protein
MFTRARRRVAAVAAALTAATALSVVGAAQPASAAPLPIDWEADVTATVGGLVNQSATMNDGRFVGEVELDNGTLSGDMTLPPATLEFNALGLLPVSTTFEVNTVEPVSGTVDLTTMAIEASYTFDIEFTSMSLMWVLPMLDPALTCMTSTPITVNLTGTLDPAAGATLTGQWAFPEMKDCGGWMGLINGFIVGPNNTIEATITPPAGAPVPI